MITLKKFKKALLLSVFTALFSITAFGQTSSAVNVATQPFSVAINPVENYTYEKSTGDIYTELLDVVRLKNVKTVERDAYLSYLKFDAMRPAGTVINSIILSLKGSGSGIVGLYAVEENWIDNVSQTTITALRKPSNFLGSIEMLDPNNDKEYNIDLSSFISNIPQAGAVSFDFVLLGDTAGTSASFYAYNADDLSTYQNGPKIKVDGYAPVPEPSSMILGIMGLSSLLGFRRKTA